jgi:hypothetical protein
MSAPTTDPADVPMITSAAARSMPRSASPAITPISQAIPVTPPPPRTSARLSMTSLVHPSGASDSRWRGTGGTRRVSRHQPPERSRDRHDGQFAFAISRAAVRTYCPPLGRRSRAQGRWSLARAPVRGWTDRDRGSQAGAGERTRSAHRAIEIREKRRGSSRHVPAGLPCAAADVEREQRARPGGRSARVLPDLPPSLSVLLPTGRSLRPIVKTRPVVAELARYTQLRTFTHGAAGNYPPAHALT